MKIHIGNNTSAFHAGSAAVITSLKTLIDAENHDISTTLRPHPCSENDIESCDILIINGEGAMQEEEKGWADFRSRNLMKNLEYAKTLGKKAYLVNSVWYRMGKGWGKVLASLDGVWVREIESARQMLDATGFKPQVFPDLSYSCPLNPQEGFIDFNGEIVIGDIYRRNTPWWQEFSHEHPDFKKFPHLGLGGKAIGNNKQKNWSCIVQSLESAGVYVTGQHHGVYAACKARTPFVSFKLYNHKISGLMKWSGIAFPIPKTKRQLFKAINWAQHNRDRYERFFDWLENQPKWPGIPELK